MAITPSPRRTSAKRYKARPSKPRSAWLDRDVPLCEPEVAFRFEAGLGKGNKRPHRQQNVLFRPSQDRELRRDWLPMYWFDLEATYDLRDDDRRLDHRESHTNTDTRTHAELHKYFVKSDCSATGSQPTFWNEFVGGRQNGL